MSTLNLQVGASADDANESDTGSLLLTLNAIAMGERSIYRHAGYRFTGVAGLSGATINSGTKLIFYSDANDDGSFIGDFYAQDAEAPGTFTTGTNDITGRARTTATCEADGSDFGTWADVTSYDFPLVAGMEIANIIQELAGSYDPSTIVILFIYSSGTGERLAESYDDASADAAKLTIDFTAATGDIVLTPDPVVVDLTVLDTTLDMGTKTLTPDPVVLDLLVPSVTVRPPDIVLTPDPVIVSLVVPDVDITVAIVLTPDPVIVSLVVPDVILDMGQKILTPDPVVVGLVLPDVSLTGTAGAIGFWPYKPFGSELVRALNPAWWPTGCTFAVVIMGYTVSAGTPVRGRLFNVTDGVVVPGSEFSSTVTTLTEIVGPAIPLPSGEKLYRIEVGGLQGGEFYCEQADVKVVSS